MVIISDAVEKPKPLPGRKILIRAPWSLSMFVTVQTAPPFQASRHQVDIRELA
jgi:hypothetical protein